MTLLGPLLFAATIILPIYLASSTAEKKTIQILDKSGLFIEVFKDEEDYTFIMDSTISLDEAKSKVFTGEVDGLLYIPALTIESPDGVALFSASNPSLSTVGSLRGKLEDKIESIKLINSGIDRAVLDNLNASVAISTINLSETGSEKESSSEAAFGIGYLTSFMIYIFIFIYGAMCMRGVIEEKTSRIIEVMISSVKPFYLMMGKVIGIAGVGLTQFVLWIILTIGIFTLGGSIFSTSKAAEIRTPPMEQMGVDPEKIEEMNPPVNEDVFSKIKGAVGSINIPLVIISFLFYFCSGYLLYGALFAAVGSAVDSDADAQQFMLPVTIPLIISIISIGAILNDPNGPVAFWLSMIPFTAPIIMMVRVPFGVPGWQLILSMLLMIGGFLFTIWLGSRIYRVGILMHGTKVNYKVLAKWFMMKN